MQEVLDFFWRVDFSHVITLRANSWESGVLVDNLGIVFPGDLGGTRGALDTGRQRQTESA